MAFDIGNREAVAWIEQFAREVDRAVETLTELDRQTGDGDIGSNMQGAVRNATSELASQKPQSAADVFQTVANSFMRAGGTSGPLFGVWFKAFAEEAKTTGSLSVRDLAAAVARGVEAVQRLGRATVGDKTMLDAMVPAAAALADAGHDQAATIGLALSNAADAAGEGAEATKGLTARRGRSSYVGEVARGVVDPGALIVAIFFTAGAGAIVTTEP